MNLTITTRAMCPLYKYSTNYGPQCKHPSEKSLDYEDKSVPYSKLIIEVHKEIHSQCPLKSEDLTLTTEKANG